MSKKQVTITFTLDTDDAINLAALYECLAIDISNPDPDTHAMLIFPQTLLYLRDQAEYVDWPTYAGGYELRAIQDFLNIGQAGASEEEQRL